MHLQSLNDAVVVPQRQIQTNPRCFFPEVAGFIVAHRPAVVERQTHGVVGH